MKKEQCDDLLQQLIYGAFKKNFLFESMTDQDIVWKKMMWDRYSESTYNLTNQANSKGIKSFRLLFDRYLLGNWNIHHVTLRISRAFIVWS